MNYYYAGLVMTFSFLLSLGAASPASGKDEIRAGMRMMLCESQIRYQGNSFSVKTGVANNQVPFLLNPNEPMVREVRRYDQDQKIIQIGVVTIEPVLLREASEAVQLLDMLIFARCRSAAMIYDDSLRDQYLIDGDLMIQLFFRLVSSYYSGDGPVLRENINQVWDFIEKSNPVHPLP